MCGNRHAIAVLKLGDSLCSPAAFLSKKARIFIHENNQGVIIRAPILGYFPHFASGTQLMSDMLDSILQDISSEQKQQIGQQLGLDSQSLDRGIEAALPVMIGGMERQASTVTGSQSLQRAVDQPTGGAEDILGQIFGNKQHKVEQGLGKVAGIDASTMASLIKILGPMVIGALAKQQMSRPKKPNVGDILTQERQKIEQRHPQGRTILGTFLDQDGDGDFDLTDVLKLGFNLFFKRR
jgi:Bacterial protein of unknown function (DUF937)